MPCPNLQDLLCFTWIVCPKRRTAPFLTGEIRLAREVTRAKGRTRLVLGSCKASREQIVLAVPPSEISQAASKSINPLKEWQTQQGECLEAAIHLSRL